MSNLADLTAALRRQLRPLGFTAGVENSLQIRRIDESRKRPESDVLIYDLEPHAAPVASGSEAVAFAPDVPLDALLAEDNPINEEHPYYAIAVYQLTASREDRGEPIAWIELLSPSNKGSAPDAVMYRLKRHELLDAGIVFVELDYLHETPPTVAQVLDYSHPQQREHPKAHPYRIIVFDPHPDIHRGRGALAEFGVESPIPTVTIPLTCGVKFTFDFGIPYQETFARQQFGYEFDGYGSLPRNFSRYSRRDQSRIGARMLTVCRAISAGREDEASAPLDETEVGILLEAEDVATAIERQLEHLGSPASS